MSRKLMTRVAEALERIAPPPAPEPSFTEATAFVWHPDPDRLEPVPDVARVDLVQLIGIDRARDTLLANTLLFARGHAANNALLWGSRGMGKPALDGRYYRTGDSVEFEPDGSISFIGRSDDVITSSGYRIGPFDVESALIEHPAVVEAAVIGVPDPERTEVVKAFVVLAKGAEASAALAEELQAHVKRRLSAHAYPRLVEFVTELPKTPSGKIQRFLLRKAEVEKQAESQV